MRHDFKNHLIAMKQYMDNVFDFGMLADSDITTGNHILDALLGMKKDRMQAEGIEFFCDVYFQRKLNIRDEGISKFFGKQRYRSCGNQ